MATSHGLGWLPDVPKPSDYTPNHPQVAPLLKRVRKLAPHVAHSLSNKDGVQALAEAPAIAPPAKVDLRSWCSPVEDQGALGSCTAQAAVGLLEYFQKRATGHLVDASRLFVYKTERDLLGWSGDTGAYLRTAMQALVLFGAPPERYWPYDGRPANVNSRYDLEPTSFCYAFGDNYRALKYFRLDQGSAAPETILATVKLFIAAGFPSMFGFPVYDEYESPLVGGLIAYPAAGSQYRGGHANVAVGYDDCLTIGADKGAVLVRNSWGANWGNAGYGWMSYRYVTAGLALDWWSLVSTDWVDTALFA
jgi:C1A family cysteine protease